MTCQEHCSLEMNCASGTNPKPLFKAEVGEHFLQLERENESGEYNTKLGHLQTFFSGLEIDTKNAVDKIKLKHEDAGVEITREPDVKTTLVSGHGRIYRTACGRR